MNIKELRIGQHVAAEIGARWAESKIISLSEHSGVWLVSETAMGSFLLFPNDISPLPSRPTKDRLTALAYAMGWDGAKIVGLIDVSKAKDDDFWYSNAGGITHGPIKPVLGRAIRWQVKPIKIEPPTITDADRDEAIRLALDHLLYSMSPSSKGVDKVAALRDKFAAAKGGAA